MTKEEFENEFEAKLESTGQKRNLVYLEITGDANDADYISEVTILDIEQFKEFLPVIKAIYFGKVTHSGERITEKEEKFFDENDYYYDLFYEITPKGDYGCHSLEISEFYFYDENGTEYYIELKGE